MAAQLQAEASTPHRFIVCPKWKRNMLRLVPGGATMMCKSCGEPHFYTRAELNAIWDELEREQSQASTTNIH